MSEVSCHTLKSNEIASVLGNLLKLAFFDNTRTNAKRAYRELEEGKTMRLPALTLPDESRTEVSLLMDCTERSGKHALSSFKQHLGAVLERIALTMQDGDVPLLSSDDGQQRVINLPIAHKNGADLNVLALGFQLKLGQLAIKLMFLDPSQFSSQGASTA